MYKTKLNNYSFNYEKSYINANLIEIYHTIALKDSINHLDSTILDYYCMFITLDGEGEIYDAENGTTFVSPNTVYFGKHGIAKFIKALSEEWHFVCFWFYLINYDLPLHQSFEIKLEDNFVETVNQIISLFNQNDMLHNAYANGLFNIILFNILCEIQAENSKNKHHDVMRDCLYYINDNLTKDLSVSMLAKKFSYCEKHFRQIFKKYTGLTPKQYILKLKIDKSCELLKNTNYSVETISALLNFSNTHHFSNTFKLLKNTTPSNYRQERSKD
jgi:AraC-like DNA-binding protein